MIQPLLPGIEEADRINKCGKYDESKKKVDPWAGWDDYREVMFLAWQKNEQKNVNNVENKVDRED